MERVTITGIDIPLDQLIGLLFKFYAASCFCTAIIGGSIGLVAVALIAAVSFAMGRVPFGH